MIVFCLASTRSGTTAIARCFRESQAFVNLGEIFYNAPDGQGHYIERWEKTAPPSVDLFLEYLEFLRSDPEHLYWVDIKFHDLARFNGLQRSLTAPPAMLQVMVDAGDPTVLISRSNCLRAASSEARALNSGVFHVAKGAENEVSLTRNEVDTGKTCGVIREAVNRRDEFGVVEDHLAHHPKLFRVEYEALFECPQAAENRAMLGQWIGAEKTSQPDLEKISRGWPEWFDRDLAREILHATDAQWWLA